MDYYRVQAYTLVEVLKRVTISKDAATLNYPNQTSIIKAFSDPNLKIQPFAIGKNFHATEQAVSELQSLSNTLQNLERARVCFYIRRSVVEGKIIPIPLKKDTFTAAPDTWCIIDIDSLAWDWDISDQRATAVLCHSAVACRIPIHRLLISFRIKHED